MKALVLYSGGQDSTVCLFWALKEYESVEAITFMYQQKHVVECHCALDICEQFKIPCRTCALPFMADIVDSNIFRDTPDVSEPHPRINYLPASFVPDRNVLFITVAHMYAQSHGIGVIVTGVSQTDYSGYPDCREYVIKAAEWTLNLASEQNIKIVTPLMYKTKADIFQMAHVLKCLNLVLERSHTCYEGDHTTKHEWGYGCGRCKACYLRRQGFIEWTLRGKVNSCGYTWRAAKAPLERSPE